MRVIESLVWSNIVAVCAQICDMGMEPEHCMHVSWD